MAKATTTPAPAATSAAQAATTTTTKGASTKQPQAVKAAPKYAAPKGWQKWDSAKRHYPQGSNPVKLLPLQSGHGRDQQKHHSDLANALGGTNKAKPLDKVLPSLPQTRRTVRRAVRAGFLVWQDK